MIDVILNYLSVDYFNDNNDVNGIQLFNMEKKVLIRHIACGYASGQCSITAIFFFTIKK